MRADHVLKDRKLQCRVIPVTRAKQNCSLIWCLETRRAAVVDPGGDLDLLRRVIHEEGVELERILITHAHPDHAGGAADLAALLDVPIEGPHRGDRSWIDRMCDLGELYGFYDCLPFTPDRWLVDGAEITVGRQTLLALHCPGHTAGHIAYFSPEARIAFVGDILFRAAIGATVEPRDHLELLRSIRLKLLPLGDDVMFVPGHLMLSTFGEERRSNPFVSDAAAVKYTHLFDDPRFATAS
jgi:hydroxyacylglutathione hydrolase